MFQKSMIAMAVLSMAAGAQATLVTQENINDYIKDNVVNVDGGEIHQPNSSKPAWTLTADSITVKNNTPSGEEDGNHAVWADGKLTLETTKGDIDLESSYLGLYVSGQTAQSTQPAELTLKSARDIKITSKSGWAIKNEKDWKKDDQPQTGYNNGLTLSAKGNIIINGANGISNNSNGDVGITLDAKAVSVNATSLLAVASGQGAITINAEEAIVVKGGSVATLRATNGDLTLNSKGSTQVTGKVVVDGKANLTAGFSGGNSFLEGSVTTDNKGGKTILAFNDNALWKATGESNVSDLTLKGGVVDLNGQTVKVDTLAKDSAGTIRMDVGADGKKTVGSFTVGKAENAKLNADLVQNADVVTSDIAKDALGKITTTDKNGKLTVTADVKEGLVNPGTVYGQDGKVLSTKGNSLMRDTLQLAQTSSLSLNRILMNDVRKRMGDLRAAEGKHGAWARYDGGRLSGEGGFENDFHTIQVGVDTMPLDNGVRFGLAGSYTKGDAEYARGDADMDAFGLAAYATWMGDNGMFVDGVARMAKASNDLTVDRDMKGKLDSLAVSLSGEFGWRFPIAANAYVEPQFEATYTYIDGEKMTLSNGKQEANYELGSFDSFLTRAGVLAGYTFPNNKGDVYVRASAVHEFLGDSEISGKTGKANHMERIDGKDTWIEFGLGGNYSVTPNTYVWADVERTTGASIETDYRATVGVRYAF